MSQKEKNHDHTTEAGWRVLVAAVVLVAVCILGPIVVLSGVGGYLLYWAWKSKPERQILRTLVVGVSIYYFFGFLRDMVLMGYFHDIAGLYLKYLSPQRHSITFDEFRSKMTTFYVVLPTVLSPAVALFFRFKQWDVVKSPYELLRSLVFLLTLPLQLVQRLAKEIFQNWIDPITSVFVSGVATFVAGPFFSMNIPAWGISLVSKNLHQFVFYDGPWNPFTLTYLLLGYYCAYVMAADQVKEADPEVQSLASSELVVGKLKGKSTELTLSWKDLNHHIHILGQPGSGKSSLLKHIYQHQIVNGAGMMVVDLKADQDAFLEIVSLCKSSGRLKDLQVIDLQRPQLSCGYNPLLRGSASELKDKLIGSLEWSEVYYKKVAERVVLNIMRGLVAVRDQHESQVCQLSDLLECLSKPAALEVLAQAVPENLHEIRADLRALAIELKNKEIFEALSGLRTDLEVMIKSEFGEILSNPKSLDLLDSIQKRKIVYVLLDGQTYGTLARRIGRMLLSDLRAASGTIVSKLEKTGRPQFTVVIDEFSDLVSDKETGQLFTGFLNRCRGSGLGVVVAHQSLGDFEDKQVMKQVLDSTETLFSFVQKDPESAETLAGIAGTKEVWQKTEQVKHEFLFGDSSTGVGTRKRVHEFLYHPNDFKNLNTGEAIYIAKKPSRHGHVVVDFKRLIKESMTSAIEAEMNQITLVQAPLLDLKSKVRQMAQTVLKKQVGAGPQNPEDAI